MESHNEWKPKWNEERIRLLLECFVSLAFVRASYGFNIWMQIELKVYGSFSSLYERLHYILSNTF